MTYEEALEVRAGIGYEVNHVDIANGKMAITVTVDWIETVCKALEQQLADGCVGCKYVDKEEWEPPCCKCKRNSKDYWRAKE